MVLRSIWADNASDYYTYELAEKVEFHGDKQVRGKES